MMTRRAAAVLGSAIRARKRARVLLVIAVPVLVVALPAATARSARDADEPAKARALAQSFIGSSTLKARVAATVGALQEGGITVLRGDTIVEQGALPQASNRLYLFQAVEMALSTRRGHPGPLSLRDFGRLLAAAGVVPRSESDRFVVALINNWVTEARADPTNPHAFVPAFLAEMAKRRTPAIDLGGAFKPQSAHLTPLEWILLSTAFGRGAPSSETTRPARWLARRGSNTPCKDVNDEWKKTVNPGGLLPLPGPNELLKDAVKKAIETVVKKAGGDADATKAVNLALKLGKIITRFQSLALFYHSATIRVFPQEADSVHKGVNRIVPFHMSAIAGLNDAAKRELAAAEFQRSTLLRVVRDCAKAAGIPVYDDLQDIADGIDKWHVKWWDFGSQTLALVPKSSFDNRGRQTTRLRRLSDTEGAATLRIDIQAENPKLHHDPDAQLVHGTWGVSADLETAKPPDLSKVKSIVQSLLSDPEYMEIELTIAIADSISDILVNWARAVVTPRDRGTVDVTEHVPCTRQLRAMIRVHLFRQTGGPACGVPSYSGVLEWTSTTTEAFYKAARAARATVSFEPVSLAHYPAVTYRVKSGAVHFEVSEDTGNCDGSGQASHALGPDEGVELDVTFRTLTHYSGFATATQLPITMAFSGPGGCNVTSTHEIGEFTHNSWWSTTDERTSSDRRSLRGSATLVDGDTTDHFTWNLNARD